MIAVRKQGSNSDEGNEAALENFSSFQLWSFLNNYARKKFTQGHTGRTQRARGSPIQSGRLRGWAGCGDCRHFEMSTSYTDLVLVILFQQSRVVVVSQ